MCECLNSPKEWSKISRKLNGRTQHQIKNRFICILSMELDYTRERIRDLMKNNAISSLMIQTLKSLRLKKQQNFSLIYHLQNEKAKEAEVNEINENTMSSYEGFVEKNEELKKNVLKDNEFDWLSNGKNQELFARQTNFNVDDFINFDM